ncbi:MAG: hypothetical protein QOD61_499, partial [Solirubrobacteraceae bacterium]|nr:hypothetical protein [Solirubrobacteraceae bacterium]
EILETNLDYHFAQGVDFALVTDHDSTDGTPEILDRYAREGMVRVFTDRSAGHDQARRVTRMARIAAVEHGADWVINNDADEFWWPRIGSLRDVFGAIPSEYGQIEVRRCNFLPRPPDGQPFFRRMVYREATSLNPSALPLESKVAHRGDPEVVVAAGNHRLLTNGLRPMPTTDLVEIFHMPMRTYEQFERKVVQIGEGYEQLVDRDDGDGRDQLKLLEVYRAGGLREYFDAHVQTEEELTAAIGAGRVVVDQRFARFLDGVQARLLARVGGGDAADPETYEPDHELVARALADSIELECVRTRLAGVESALAKEREESRGRAAAEAERDAAIESLELLRNSHLVRHTKTLRQLYYRVRPDR